MSILFILQYATVTHKVYHVPQLITWDLVVRVLLIYGGNSCIFHEREENFVIKSATGSNRLIARKVQHWRSERGITAALTAFKDILRNACICLFNLLNVLRDSQYHSHIFLVNIHAATGKLETGNRQPGSACRLQNLYQPTLFIRLILI